MPLLADAARRDANLLRVAAALAANVNVGRPFAQALLAFLVHTRLPTLQQPASPARARSWHGIQADAAHQTSQLSACGGQHRPACLMACQGLPQAGVTVALGVCRRAR